MILNTMEDLVFALICEIGLGITPEGFLYDQDTGIILQYNGMQIKASVNRNAPAIATNIVAAFDPVFDPKIMQVMLGYYAKKCEELGYLTVVAITENVEDIPSYNNFDNLHTKRGRITVSLEDGRVLSSNYYYQKGLKYSDIILRMGGNNVDLQKFDSLPEDSILEY